MRIKQETPFSVSLTPPAAWQARYPDYITVLHKPDCVSLVGYTFSADDESIIMANLIYTHTQKRYNLSMHSRKYNGKTIKQPYRKSRRFAASCRCHGTCPYCMGNRMHNTRRRLLDAEDQLSEYGSKLSFSIIWRNRAIPAIVDVNHS